MKTPTTKRRLKKLIAYMRSLPASANRHFNMTLWFSHKSEDHRHRVGHFIDRKALEHCGTSACALGWAATIPSFQRAGLKVRTMEAGPAPMRLGKRFFGLTTDQFEDLFVPSIFERRAANDVHTPKQWARKAERALREWEAE